MARPIKEALKHIELLAISAFKHFQYVLTLPSSGTILTTVLNRNYLGGKEKSVMDPKRPPAEYVEVYCP